MSFLIKERTVKGPFGKQAFIALVQYAGFRGQGQSVRIHQVSVPLLSSFHPWTSVALTTDHPEMRSADQSQIAAEDYPKEWPKKKKKEFYHVINAYLVPRSKAESQVHAVICKSLVLEFRQCFFGYNLDSTIILGKGRIIFPLGMRLATYTMLTCCWITFPNEAYDREESNSRKVRVNGKIRNRQNYKNQVYHSEDYLFLRKS